VLWCSEATIYGRFGYGRATSEAEVTVDRHRAGIDPAVVAGAGLRAEIGDPADSLAEVEALYETIRAVRPGMPRRSAAWQRTAIGDYDSQRAGASRLRTVLFRDGEGTVRAAIRYRVEGWAAETATSPRRTRVSELYADSPGAWAAAWSWIGELDLVGGYRAGSRPVDDPLLLQLIDLRAAKVEPGDALWVRLVDLPAALAARGYAGTTEAVVEVTDATLPANAGRWRIATTPEGAQVTRTDEPGDLSLDTAVLAEAYLGSAGSLVRSLQAGRVTEHRPGAVSALSRAFDSDVAPWCPVHF
jgi:predicted acetyltransferase